MQLVCRPQHEPFSNSQCFELAATKAHRHTLTAAATHLHDKGLVNYLRSLIWSIQESCIRLQGQSEPLDSIGLHYSWEPHRGTRREGGREKREGARDREQQQRRQGLVSCVLKVFLFRCWWIFYRVWNLDGTSICRGESGGEGLGGNCGLSRGEGVTSLKAQPHRSYFKMRNTPFEHSTLIIISVMASKSLFCISLNMDYDTCRVIKVWRVILFISMHWGTCVHVFMQSLWVCGACLHVRVMD